MSSAPKLTKKQKKALAFRERKGKGKAKTFDDLDNDIPVEENQDLAEAEDLDPSPPLERPEGRAPSAQEGEGETSRNAKGKKRKREDKTDEADEEVAGGGDDAKPPQGKKKRKGADGQGIEAGKSAETNSSESSKQRYILFVGNLKYATSKEAIEAHFAKCDPPPTVRLMTPKPKPGAKPTTKSKGCAFVEFSHRNALQQGLKLHQSQLDGRMINVELTAGGGGKSQHRLEKVKQRNKDLYEQRKKRVLKRTSGKKSDNDRNMDEDGDVRMERPQRYSATSGVEQAPFKKRTWSIPEEGDTEGASGKKRGSKKAKKRPPKPLGTGVNAIPVG